MENKNKKIEIWLLKYSVGQIFLMQEMISQYKSINITKNRLHLK